MGAVKNYYEEKNMKNLKKLLVTMLALVLLICGATVVSLAADTPAEIMADAQELLDAATKEGEFIAVRSQKMRELDKLIADNMATIRNDSEWLSFQVSYKAHQDKLREDCVAEATAALDQLLERSTTKKEAELLYAGLSTLVSRTGEGRGYFDTESAEFAELTLRMKIAEPISKLQIAEDSVLAKDKGASLKWVDTYRAAYLADDAAVTATEDYAIMNEWFKALYAEIDEAMFAEIRALTDKACLASTSFKDAEALVAEIEAYLANCYFDTTAAEYSNTLMYAKFAGAYTYLNQIERTKVLVTQGELLKTLSEMLADLSLSSGVQPMYDDFFARYNKLVDATDEASVVSRLRVIADGYKADVAAVFTEGYNGPLKSADDIADVVDEFQTLVSDCYLGTSTYAADLSVAKIYAAIYDFYAAMVDPDEAPDAYIARNKLYKAAISSYNNNAGALNSAEPAYANTMIALYDTLCADAKAEITEILDGWVATVASAGIKDADGVYVTAFAEVREAMDCLSTHYLGKTPLYFREVEDKALTAKIKGYVETAETRVLGELCELLATVEVEGALPENLADMDATALAYRVETLAALSEMFDGLVFSFGTNPDDFAVFISDYHISTFLTKLCEIEAAFKAEDDEGAVALYNELKSLVSTNITAVDTEAEAYLLYLSHLNKIEVRMGDANVPGARPYLDAVAAVVDNDSFEKVYKLMELDEYMRQNKITRPDPSDTTSASALFYAEYDELANKIKVWRQAIVDEREKDVPMSDYNSTAVTEYDADTKQASATKYNHTFIPRDGREYGSEGSQFYTTLEMSPSGGDGFINLTLPSPTENVVIEMDITTFTHLPPNGIPFDSGTNTLDTNTRIYPFLCRISANGELIAAGGNHNNGPTVTGPIIIPGQWTHLVICYNAKEKMVSYYVNDEKIVYNGVDAWSCAYSTGPYNFKEALRVGNGGTSGSFSIDSVRLYLGNAPRDVNFLRNMSTPKKFAYFVDFVKSYIDEGKGTATDAKTCYEELRNTINVFWGTRLDPDGNPLPETYLFDETTYWSGAEDVGITYEELKKAVDDFHYVAEHADAVIEAEMVEECYNNLNSQMDAIKAAAGIAKLATRQNLLADFEAYVEANLSYIAAFNDTQKAGYAQMLADKAAIELEVEAYSRANEYITMVNKFAAARDLYSRTVYRNDAALQMAEMERDAALGYFNLEQIKGEIAEFAAAIETFSTENAKLEAQIVKDNNRLIVDCMARFPATADEAMKNYATLNKYIVAVRRILGEGNYDAKDPDVEAAIAKYNVMNASFYDALQRDHAAFVQELIDEFNATNTAYIAKLGIYRQVKSYLEENAETIDLTHDAIKGIYSQFEIMDAQFGTEEGREEQWKEYETILASNTLKFIALVTQMRFETSYDEVLRLRDEAAKLFYYMDSTTPEAQLAIENYQACEQFLAQATVNADKFIETVYKLKKATDMKSTYLALVAAQAAFAEIDVTCLSSLTFYERGEDKEIAVVLTTEEAIETYQITLSQYTSFVTVTNAESDVVLDVVCTVRAAYPTTRTMVALFKKFYD